MADATAPETASEAPADSTAEAVAFLDSMDAGAEPAKEVAEAADNPGADGPEAVEAEEAQDAAAVEAEPQEESADPQAKTEKLTTHKKNKMRLEKARAEADELRGRVSALEGRDLEWQREATLLAQEKAELAEEVSRLRKLAQEEGFSYDKRDQEIQDLKNRLVSIEREKAFDQHRAEKDKQRAISERATQIKREIDEQVSDLAEKYQLDPVELGQEYAAKVLLAKGRELPPVEAIAKRLAIAQRYEKNPGSVDAARAQEKVNRAAPVPLKSNRGPAVLGKFEDNPTQHAIAYLESIGFSP